jgi:non-ribosomal peptide synthetase component F/acyl carrier protein
VEHAGLANTAADQARGWELKAGDGFLQFSAPMFDASIAEIFAALVAGSRLVIAPKDVILDPVGFLELLLRNKVTVAILPPAYLSALGRAALPSLRLLGTAGEAANPADAAFYNRTLTYVNAYGPTESSICATFLKLEAGAGFAGERVPVGKPLPHTDIYILNENLQLMPVGAAGEICVGGVNVARGYLNRPDLTNERFVPSPFREDERLYRTGDLGRQLPDGNIEFLGRRDTQVKIRGYRVELGEVETLLKTHPAIETAAVLGGADGDLVAYVVPRGGFHPGELRRFLALKLPAYMIPSRWVDMPALPLNSSGKVARSALPAQLAAVDEAGGAATPFTAVEKVVAGIWEEVLGSGPVSRTGDFFELGGHSLKAVGILSRIQRSLGARVELKEFFSGPTVAQLATLIETRRCSREEPIPPAPVMDVYPLSHAQARIWVLSQMEGGGVAYNMPVALDLEGELDVSALEQALWGVIARHESLRTCFVMVDGTPRQKIVATGEIEFRLDEEDLRKAESAEEEANRRLCAEVATPFDLTRAPLMRARLFRLSERRWLFSLVVHHIVGDGWSLEVLLKELASCYAGGHLSPLPLQYKDHSGWMTRRLEENAFAADRDFWVAKLAGPLPVLNVPSDHPRPEQMGFSGKIERFALPLASESGLQAFCAGRGVSPFMLLLAGAFGLLHRYTGDEDLIIGTPVAGRDRLDLEAQVGLYLNTLALRVRAERGMTLAELLDRVRTAVLEAHEHQAYPFDLLIGDLKLERRTDRNPVFDVMVVMQNAVSAGFRLGGVEASEHAVPADVSVFDLTFHFAQNGPGMRLYLEYNTSLFNRERMELLARHLDQLLAAIVSKPDGRLDEVEILTADERKRILQEFGDGPRVAMPAATVLDLFAEQAEQTPDRTAVIFERKKLTYGELASAASLLAARITSRVAAGPGSVVALVADRSERMVAGVLGIMASGAACLPIDATLPAERIRYLLEDSGCQAVVSDGAVEIGAALPVILLSETAGGQGRPLAGSVRGSDIAYITYTSGSTGIPKGSLIEHRSLANLVVALGEVLYKGLPQPATELLLTSIGFDVALKQIFGALTRGNAVAIAGTVLRYDPKALMAAIVDDHIHLIDITPAHFAVLLAQGFARLPKPELKVIVLGSEALPCGVVEAFAKEEANRHIALFNFYGPSECTVETLFCRLNETSLA